uniref:BBS2_C domain-containing protein n=1 Tax=Heterorhabditis bacteriophora TaxID=37862 RepID=A0A1I7XV71_HETBA
MTMSGQQVVAGFLSKMSDKQTQEVTIVLADGRVQCYELTQKRDTVDKNQETLRLFGQKKHNLLMELNNFEHEEHLSEAEKEKDHRIPIGTTVDCKLFVAKSDHVLYLVLEASNNVCIRGVIAFAEGVFEGESFIWNKLSVFETVLSIPRFARFCLLKPEDDFTMSTSFVEFILKMRNQRILDWVIDNFLVDVDLSIDQEQDEIEIRFGGLASNKHIGLYIRHTQSDGKVYNDTIVYFAPCFANDSLEVLYGLEVTAIGIIPTHENYQRFSIGFKSGVFEGQSIVATSLSSNQVLVLRLAWIAARSCWNMKIHHDSIETVSNIVQSICDYFALETLESQANFPEIFAEVEEISNELDSMYDVRDRLTTDLSEKQYLLKEVLVRAEDALVIDNLSLIRKYYTRLRHMDRSMRQAFFLRSNNHERFVQSLRRLNKIIEHMARLRCIFTIPIMLVVPLFAYRDGENSHLVVREKRQNYYLCGTAPNTYYSTTLVLLLASTAVAVPFLYQTLPLIIDLVFVRLDNNPRSVVADVGSAKLGKHWLVVVKSPSPLAQMAVVLVASTVLLPTTAVNVQLVEAADNATMVSVPLVLRANQMAFAAVLVPEM